MLGPLPPQLAPPLLPYASSELPIRPRDEVLDGVSPASYLHVPAGAVPELLDVPVVKVLQHDVRRPRAQELEGWTVLRRLRAQSREQGQYETALSPAFPDVQGGFIAPMVLLEEGFELELLQLVIEHC